MKNPNLKKNQTNTTDRKKSSIIIISIILVILVITGIIYFTIHDNIFIHQDTVTTLNDKEKSLFYQEETNPLLSIDNYFDMSLSNDMRYKKISNYDEYLKETELWTSLIEMNENDFQDSFILITCGLTYKNIGLYISDIYTKEDKTCVELKRKDRWSNDTTAICTKISKELDKENIEIIILPNMISTNGKYMELNEIPSTYTIEQALNDGCFVVENYGNIISKYKNQLDEFIEKKENDVLRVCRYGPNYILIMDIQYNNDVVNINSRSINLNENKINPPMYFTGDKLRKNVYTDYDGIQRINYFCENELGDTENICTINNN